MARRSREAAGESRRLIVFQGLYTKRAPTSSSHKVRLEDRSMTGASRRKPPLDADGA